MVQDFFKMIRSTQTAEHYTWGERCDGWHLLRSEALSVIQERMPLNTSEAVHFHSQSQQLFYILSVPLHLLCISYTIKAQECLHVAPRQHHNIANLGKEDLHFLVISRAYSAG